MTRLDWKDLTEEARRKAVAATIRYGRLTREEAEEVVANAVTRLMRLRPEARDPTALLIKTSINLLINDLRKQADRPMVYPLEKARRSEDGDVEQDEPCDIRADHVAELMEEEDRRRHLGRFAKALAKLSPADVLIINAHYFEGRPLQAIDEERGERLGTAKVRLFRARDRLIRAIQTLECNAERMR